MKKHPQPTWISTLRKALPLLLVVVVVLLMATDVLACPTCKDGLAESDPASQAQARGFFYSILFMMAMPFVILGTFGSAAYFSIRKAREKQLIANCSANNRTECRKSNGTEAET